jgi:hypothetical protein
MQLFENIVTRADAYRQILYSLKSQHKDLSWYPYDTLYNLVHLRAVIDDEFDELFRGGKKFADIGAADRDLAFYLESLGNSVDIYDYAPTNYNSLRGAKETEGKSQ